MYPQIKRMKSINLLIIVFVFLSSFLPAQEINWISVEEALSRQEQEPRKIIMDVYTTWCGPCKMLDKNTFKNPDVIKYINENFYAIKFNAEGNKEIRFKDKVFTNPNYDPAKAKRRNSPHEFSRFLRISAFPTIVFLDEQAGYIAGIKGYQGPQQIELYLKLFNSEDYKGMDQDAFNAYYQSFKPSFAVE
jgi:thioredoxin-related protein